MLRQLQQQRQQLQGVMAGAVESCQADPFSDSNPSPAARACRRNGWYPAVLGPGNLAAKGRVPYAILGLMDALRLFPGQARSSGGGRSSGGLAQGRDARAAGSLAHPLSQPHAHPLSRDGRSDPTHPLTPFCRSLTPTLCCTPPTLPASSAAGATAAAARRSRCWASRARPATWTCPSQSESMGEGGGGMWGRVVGACGGCLSSWSTVLAVAALA